MPEAKNYESLVDIDTRVSAVIDQTGDADDETLVMEFHALFVDQHAPHGTRRLAAQRLLLGWLGGVVVSATWEQKATIEANAYAEARVREERGVGFSNPTVTG